jgi:hypothetical protein
MLYLKLISTLLFITLSLSLLANPDLENGMKAYKKGDYKTALILFKKADEEGKYDAQMMLGIMHELGEGVIKDYETALSFYDKARRNGSFESEEKYIALKDKIAISLYQKSATQGNSNDQYNLGKYYSERKGWNLKPDFEKSFYWLKKAAEQGHLKAQFRMGLLHHFDRDIIPKNHQKALYWYQKAAEQGHSQAQFNLAKMYGAGEGVERNKNKFNYWISKSAENGHTTAQFLIARNYRDGNGVTKDYEKAVEWYEKSSEGGFQAAQIDLGEMYEDGLGVDKDVDKAFYFYGKTRLRLSNERYSALKEKLNNKDSNTTKVFGVAIKYADRYDLRRAVRNVGATVKREQNKDWGDTYFTENVLKGSTELNIVYTASNVFAKATYTFPRTNNPEYALGVKEFVSNKYGKPDNESSNQSSGDMSYKWKLDDGIEIEVSSEQNNNVTYLSFTSPKRYKEMIDAKETQQKALDAKKYESQSDAF